MTDPQNPTSVVDSLSYPESPRWHGGRLWISDVHAFCLKAFDLDGRMVEEIEVPGRPAGTGFRLEEMLVATAVDKKVCKVVGQRLHEIVDLSGMTTGLLNDMVVDQRGRAYVGDTGFRFGTDDPQLPGRLIIVDEDNNARVVAEDVIFPNGMVITPDGKTLLVAETFANRVSAFEIASDGSLSGRRLHADLPGTPDGMCLDSNGGLWIALLAGKAFIRIDASGHETHRLTSAPDNAIACMIGGAEGRTLFLCHAQVEPERRGTVSAVAPPYAAAGLP